ncbi:ankyrin repeat protein [Leptospira noguchii str. Cascata]|nr:ankyrin repeat protein [Leptospira noguchii str. Cascata]
MCHEKKKFEIAKYLIEKEVSVNVRDEYGRNPLIYAIQYRQKEILELMLTKGGDIHTKNDNGYNLLAIAVENGDQSIVEVLLEKGLNINDLGSVNMRGKTP